MPYKGCNLRSSFFNCRALVDAIEQIVCLVEAERCAHPIRRQHNMRAQRLCVRAHGGVPGGGVVRQLVDAGFHAAERQRPLLVQAARAAPARPVLGSHARASRHVCQLHYLGTHCKVYFIFYLLPINYIGTLYTIIITTKVCVNIMCCLHPQYTNFNVIIKVILKKSNKKQMGCGTRNSNSKFLQLLNCIKNYF